MFLDRLDSDRFFARARAFDLSCPRCSRVAVVRRRSTTWDPSTSRWQCSGCGLVLTIGIVAWPRKRGSRAAPLDQVPTWRESLGMRNDLSGILPVEAKGNREPVNVILREGCSCREVKGRRWVDEDCPIHGFPKSQESDAKAEPRWMRQKRQWLAGEEGGRLKARGTTTEFDEDDEDDEDEDEDD